MDNILHSRMLDINFKFAANMDDMFEENDELFNAIAAGPADNNFYWANFDRIQHFRIARMAKTYVKRRDS